MTKITPQTPAETPISIKAEPLTPEAFEAFGDVISFDAAARHFPINGGTTERYHALSSAVAFGEDAHVIISLARAKPFQLPLKVAMLERHPFGSQAFVPLSPTRFLVVVAADRHGQPGTPRAFLAQGGQGINYFRNTWHGVLSVLDNQADFLVVDREGDGENLEEFQLDKPYEVTV